MPYIPRKDRERASVNPDPKRSGETNFFVFRQACDTFAANPSYAMIEKIFEGYFMAREEATTFKEEATLLLVLMEFYRRIGSKYEDYCIDVNGDLIEAKEALASIERKRCGE